MKSITLLIKPASSLCNLRCRYCFYADIAGQRTVPSYGIMTMDTAERLIASAFQAVGNSGQIQFTFQGGEPTLAGLPFFQRFVELAQAHSRPGAEIHWSIQTNGMVLDDTWAAFFRDHNFLVGLSADGTREIHDACRVDPEGNGTWQTVTAAAALLKQYDVSFNLLCVVTKQCARRAQKVYHALQKLGSGYIQFIPCLDALEEQRGSASYSLTPEAYGSFLCTLLDAWYLDWKGGRYTSVRLFDDYIQLLMGLPPGTCATSGQCGSYLVVESDGSLYPCDFYVLDRWRLGDIRTCTLEEAAASGLAQDFLAEGRRRPQACLACRWYPICRGGCKRDWQQHGGQTEHYYCTSFQRFFSYAAPRLEEIARAELLARRGR